MLRTASVVAAVLALITVMALAPAQAFSSAPGLLLRQSTGHSLAAAQPRYARSASLRMQEDPPKQTTGFGKLFKNLSSELTAETAQVDETGKRTLKATPAQIVVLVFAQFAIPITLYQIYKAVKGG